MVSLPRSRHGTQGLQSCHMQIDAARAAWGMEGRVRMKGRYERLRPTFTDDGRCRGMDSAANRTCNSWSPILLESTASGE